MDDASLQPGTVASVLEEKIRNRTARAGIVGLGYVGLPLAVEFGKAGFPVIGIDVQESKVSRLNAGESYIRDVPGEFVRSLLSDGKLRATTDFSVIAELDTINICVP
ncbi:MAG: UDP-N-acetyl-D-glucosamine dehydrogenase, partial [Bryobacteraceae bacterium]|nr:UDP-N-acetyl-D-glucosamine dehydrogenase [Bryobacteraceae bacterium]